MDSKEGKLLHLIKGDDKGFIIPVYQRNYDWKREQCEQLYSDLRKLIKEQRESHFFGCIVTKASEKDNDFVHLSVVIDGQQRITTVSLLLLALYKLLAENKLTEVEPDKIQKRIRNKFITLSDPERENPSKLYLVERDDAAFFELLKEDGKPIPDSNITANYNYFYHILQKREFTVEELYDALCKLRVIGITLDPQDNPQLIFESLNSTGLDLKEGDKVRNFILMGLDADRQQEYYKKYWRELEILTQDNVSDFIRDFLTVKRHAVPSRDRVYQQFKEYALDGGAPPDALTLLQELCAYARRYHTLLVGETTSKELNESILRLNRLDTPSTRPFFLEILRLYDEKLLTTAELVEIFLMTESALFRRFVCDLIPNAFNKLFVSLFNELVNYDGATTNLVEKYKRALASRRDETRVPKDDEFAKAFRTRDFYHMKRKNVYALERLENFGTKETNDVYQHVDAKEYTLEHIMPQRLSPEWRSALGDDYATTHELWVDRIANLTFTAYNSKYSNRSFQSKKEMEHGFNESGLKLNQFVAKQEKWTAVELEARADLLAQKALAIWPRHESTYQPPEKAYQQLSLAAAPKNFTNRRVAKFRYKTSEQLVNSWSDVFDSVVAFLYHEDAALMHQLALAKNEEDAFVTTDPAAYYYTHKIADGLYIRRPTSTQERLVLLRRLFKKFHIALDELVFCLYEEDLEAKKEKSLSDREIRYKFWSFALDAIRAAHLETGCFQTSPPNPSIYCADHFGVGGVDICCSAQSTKAFVRITLYHSMKSKNQERFAKLYASKEAIEDALGVELIWDQNENRKACLISYELLNVDVRNEADWPMMKNFLAEWSKKLYDQLVPRIKEFVGG